MVLATDHGTANPGLNGTGREYCDTNASFERLLASRNSFALVTPRLGVRTDYTMKAEGGGTARPKPPAEQVKEVIRTAFGIEPSPQDTESLRNVSAGAKNLSISKQLDKMVGILGEVLANHTGVGWTGTSHTADYTVLTALGPGSKRFHGFLRNTDVFPILCDFINVGYRNPSMTPEKARQYRTEAASVDTPRTHWA